MSIPPPPPHQAAGRLAQLLADTIVQHAPHTAKISTDETVRQVNTWLDGLEAHAGQFVTPFVTQILEHSDPPDAIKALLAEVGSPGAAFAAPLLQIFLYSIIQQVVGVAVGPFLQGTANTLTQEAVKAGSVVPINPAVLATATARGLAIAGPYTLDVPPEVLAEAAKSGTSPESMKLQASIVGLPPALQELFELLRRGVIGTNGPAATIVDTGATPALDHNGQPLTVETGLKEGDFRDDWINAAVQLAHAFLTPLDFVNAAVREQMSYEDARKWAHVTGLDWDATVPLTPGAAGAEQDMFGLAYSIAGRPPGPQELAAMTHRGIIAAQGGTNPETTFYQGIAESDVKTKWTAGLLELSNYLPTVEEVGTLLKDGGLTPDQAGVYWAKRAVQPEMVAALTFVATQEAHKQERLLVKGDVLKGYYDGIFPNVMATEMLASLGYSGPVAAEMLEIQDFRRQIRAIDQVVRKVGTLYETFKISATDALATMADLGIPLSQAQALLGTWDELRIRPLRVPTTSEIGRAVKAGTITQAEGLTELADLGYQPRDAAIVLSSESGAAVVPLPPAGTTTTG